MSRRTLFLIFALFLITVTLLLVALYQPQGSNTPPPTKPTVKQPIAQTVLTFGAPVIATSSSASTFNYSLPIYISTGNNKVTAVQLELQYDPAVLIDMTVVPGPFFPKPDILLDQIDTKTGRISYAFSAGLTSEGVTGKDIVANLTFSAKTQTPARTAIIFLPKTLVTAQGVSISVLKQAANSLFTTGEKPSTPSAQ